MGWGKGKGRKEKGEIPKLLAYVTWRMRIPFTEMGKNGEG